MIDRRRLSRRETALWYSLAAVSYTAVGAYEKWLLTWFLGPAWLIAFVVIGPAIWDRIRRV